MTKKKLKLNNMELHHLYFVFLCCEDLAVPNGGCEKCILKEDCFQLQVKMFGKVVTA
uniref:Uncharacterized protein n=1 Tax=viral metagenome TaxID=1070528 RepID=A0A6H1ZST1_9ZZZZ